MVKLLLAGMIVMREGMVVVWENWGSPAAFWVQIFSEEIQTWCVIFSPVHMVLVHFKTFVTIRARFFKRKPAKEPKTNSCHKYVQILSKKKTTTIFHN